MGLSTLALVLMILLLVSLVIAMWKGNYLPFAVVAVVVLVLILAGGL